MHHLAMLLSRKAAPLSRMAVTRFMAGALVMSPVFGPALETAWGARQATSLSTEVTIEMNASQAVKDISGLRRGILISPKTTDYVLAKYAKEVGMMPALVRIPLDFGWMPDPSFIDPLIEKVRRWGGEPLIFVVGTPRALAVKSHAGLYQDDRVRKFDVTPRNLGIWQDMVRRAVAHFNAYKRYQIKYLEIWNEPDALNFWSGTEEEYFQLFRASVKGALSADRAIKIGGPAVASWRGEIGGRGPLIRNLLEFARAERLPMHFISWHAFENDPYGLPSVVNRIRKWRDASGFQHAQLFLNEWNHPDSVKRDGPEGAAFVGAMLSAILDSGLDRQAFAMLQDGDISKADFSGDDFGLFTISGIAKASFNVFRATGMLGDSKLAVRQEGGQYHISTLATKGRGVVTIFVSYAPPDPVAVAVNSFLSEYEYTNADLIQWGWNHETSEQLRRGETEAILARLRIPRPARAHLEKAFELYHKIARETQYVPKRVHLVIRGLGVDGALVYKRYVIERQHSNGLRVADRIRKTLERMGQEARELALNGAERFLARDGSMTVEGLRELMRDIRRVASDEMGNELVRYKRTAPARIRRALEEAEGIFQRTEERELRKGLDEINEWAEVRLTQVEQATVDVGREFRKTMEVTPFSVNVLVIQTR